MLETFLIVTTVHMFGLISPEPNFAMIVLTFLWFAFVANVLTISAIKARYQRVTHHIDRVMGAILAGLGIKILLSSRE